MKFLEPYLALSYQLVTVANFSFAIEMTKTGLGKTKKYQKKGCGWKKIDILNSNDFSYYNYFTNDDNMDYYPGNF